MAATNNETNASSVTDTVSNSELKSIILRLEKSLSLRLDKLESEISDMKISQAENKDRIDTLNHDVQGAKQDITSLKDGEIPVLDGKYQRLADKITLMEIHDRKKNLLFYGVKQERNEDNMFAVLRKCWIDDFGVTEEEAEYIAVADAHRLPSREPRQGPDPIIVRFVYARDRDLILEKARKRPFFRDRKPANVYTDLPPEMKKLRGKLAVKAKELRQQGNQTRIRVVGTKVLLEYRERRRRGENAGLWTQYTNAL